MILYTYQSFARMGGKKIALDTKEYKNPDLEPVHICQEKQGYFLFLIKI